MSFIKNPGFVLRFSIAIAYVSLGIIIFFIKELAIIPSYALKTALGVLLIVYGIFRGYRAIKMYNNTES